ncbi:MAG: hypothetical protein LLG06_00555 [Desulfobacteraceae bacterium]|nr:hypothetical protein [Desulfobacteraceae bacterium]
MSLQNDRDEMTRGGRGGPIRMANGHRPFASLLLFLAGIGLFLAVQGFLIVTPLRECAFFPKADDSLTYVLKTAQMEGCLLQDCPAYLELREQLNAPSQTPEAAHQRALAGSKLFPVYHPLFSLVLLAISKLGGDLISAYRLVWYLGPLLFAASFACLLAVLFGRGVAGIALALLAFKVFPDTGLHHIVPSNVTMALAGLVWARIIAQRGDAPWTLGIGSLLLCTMHLVGVIYSAMALALALLLAGTGRRRKILPGIGFGCLVVALVLFLPHFIRVLPTGAPSFLPPGTNPILHILTGAARSLVQVVVEARRLMDGLFGWLPVFCGAVTFGFLSLPRERSGPVAKFLGLYAVALFGLLFYVSSHPADVLLRVWIPFVVVLFGLVGQTLLEAARRTRQWMLHHRGEPREGSSGDAVIRFWPPVVLAVLLGYAFNMSVLGAEQVLAYKEHQRVRQPLDLNPEQPRLLLERAAPGDGVLYTSFTVMPFYLIHGAMGLGAVYYHPALRDDELGKKWLARPGLRFAATYNPLVFHPSFIGVDEHRWWITSPDFHASPLSTPRKWGPLAREGKLAAAEFHSIEVDAGEVHLPGLLRVLIDNPGRKSEFIVSGVRGRDSHSSGTRVEVPAGWSGWMEIASESSGERTGIRLVFPDGGSRMLLGGIAFGRGGLLWPWAAGAKMHFMPKSAWGERISVSFDPADLIPEPLNRRQVTVLDDRGSSVLVQIDGP